MKLRFQNFDFIILLTLSNLFSILINSIEAQTDDLPDDENIGEFCNN
jgi:hypothetical protein